MKRSVLGLMYLIQGMRKAGVAVDQKLQSIGLRVESLDPNAIIHPALEWDILKIIAEDIEPEQGLFIGQHYVLAGIWPFTDVIDDQSNDTYRVRTGYSLSKFDAFEMAYWG